MKLFLLLLSISILINDCRAFHNEEVKRVEAASPKQDPPVTRASRYTVPDEDRVLLEKLLKEAKAYTGTGKRMRVISERLLGSRYVRKPLKGSLKSPEEIITRMDGFDCVTYVETVLALSKANSVDEFMDHLLQIRYKDGKVDYTNRLHYIYEWNKIKISSGELQDLTQGEKTIERTKTLNVVKGIEPQVAQIRYFPKSRLNAVSNQLQDGDLIYFVTAQKGLDFSHMGVIFLNGERIVMRHSTRRRMKVVEQDLADFFRKTPMQGFVIHRPAN